MKKLSAYLFLILFSFSAPSFADDIRDFQIEGISLGDSLLDYYSEEKINSNLRNFYDHTDKKFSVTLIADLQSNELYDYLQIHFKTNDKRYIIHAVDGLVDINIDECYKRQKKIEKELSAVLKNAEKKGPINFKIKRDKTGKSTITAFYYFFKSGDYGEVSCYDFAEHMDMPDGLNVAISSEEIGEWLKKDW